MATWANLSLQDSASPLMEQLTFFHDHAMLILIMITALVSYLLATLFFNLNINRYLLEGQTIEVIWTIFTSCNLNFYCFTFSPFILFISWSKKSCNYFKNNWSSMMLKLWMLSFYPSWVWLLYNSLSWNKQWWFSFISRRQSSGSSHKYTNSYTSDCCRRLTFMNCTGFSGKGWCYPWTFKSNKILNKSTSFIFWSMFSNLRGKPQFYAYCYWKSSYKCIHKLNYIPKWS
uniref:Cytochrome c oxidase subunit 2 n=1 Tax=Nemoura nankinensis TaxID=1986504 RepID=A0A3S5FW60_9NEOP|nr:cytochrome c oxidase subunit II [Nemoura nankinensis]ARQ82448.1 cytochrome c oxidase subunit II [Nemoura nankinensis]